MKLRLLLTGVGGLFGNRLRQTMADDFDLSLHFHNPPAETIPANVVVGDLCDENHIEWLAKKITPDIIVNSAALVNVDRCETEPELSKKINITAVRLLLDAFPKAKFVQISTDYVFGDRDKPGAQNDQTGPINVYGRHKLAAEEAVANASEDNLIVRINFIFDYTKPHNFFRFVHDRLKRNKTVSAATDQSSNPISALSGAELVVLLLKKGASGIFHTGGREHVSRYEFACRIAEHFGLKTELIIPIEFDSLARPAARPKVAGLDCSATENYLHIVMPGLSDQFAHIAEEQ